MADRNDSSRGSHNKRTWRSYRQRHRQRSHAQAHAEARQASIPPVLEHPMVPQAPPDTVETQADLLALVDSLRTAGRFAYDSEFIGEETYYPRFCVIQVATTEKVTLIDALAEIDLTPFWELIADEGVPTIVHAGQQDLEPVYRILDRTPGEIFDTQIAAAFLGLNYPCGLSKLVESLLDADLGPGLKFSQWDERPLSDVQKHYAANDVRYLPLLHESMVEQLTKIGRLEWVREENEQFSHPATYQVTPAGQRLRMRGAGMLDTLRRARLEALVQWRDGAAREFDVPPRSLVKDALLLELTRLKPITLEAIRRVRGLPRPVKGRLGEAILRALEEARPETGQADDGARRLTRREIEATREQADVIWQRVRGRCDDDRIDPAIVTSKRELTHLVRRFRERGDWGACVAESRLGRGWRGELLGDILRDHPPAA